MQIAQKVLIVTTPMPELNAMKDSALHSVNTIRSDRDMSVFQTKYFLKGQKWLQTAETNSLKKAKYVTAVIDRVQ